MKTCEFWGFLFAIYALSFDRGRRGRDSMVVGFTTAYAMGEYYH
jgi:hypothetical protein